MGNNDVTFGAIQKTAVFLHLSRCQTPPPPQPCNSQPRHRDMCAFITNARSPIFGRCIAALDPSATSAIYAACLLDACYTNGSSLCRSLKTFVDECAYLGFVIPCSVWQSATGCGKYNHGICECMRVSFRALHPTRTAC
jgi:hypothetical protein